MAMNQFAMLNPRLALIGLATALALAGAVEAKTFRTNIRADPAMMDPITYSEIVSGDVLDNIYEGFSEVADDGSIIPALATKWEASADNKTWRFTLRRGVKFHSGREFTAKDVKFTMETLMTPGMKGGLTTTYLKKVVGADALQKGETKELTGVKIIDPYTVEINLVEADVLFPIYPFYFMDAAIPAEHGADWWNKVSAGTGPFKFVHWRRGVEIKLDAHKDYWGGAPKIDGVQFLIVPSGDTVLSMYDAGALDFSFLPELAMRRALRDPRYAKELISVPRAQSRYMGMNQNLYAPFKDKRVREAISAALDRDAMIKGLFNDAGFPLHGVITPGVAGYNPNIAKVSYDPARAKKLLAEAGYPDGKGMPPLEISNPPDFKDEITYYANQLKRVLGIEVKVVTVERATFIKAMNAGEVSFFPWGWTAGYPDAMYYLSQMWHSKSPYNRARYSNGQYDALIDKAQTVADPTARFKLYHEAEKILMDDWATIPLPIPALVALRKPNVKNVTMTSYGYSSFHKIEIQ
jgi:peptide/nickel transport system substrate-binding protein